MAPSGNDPLTSRFSVVRSNQLSYRANSETIKKLSLSLATRTGLEPATSAVTGRRSNQLSYRAICGEPQYF